MTYAAHHLSFRAFCGLFAAFWTALILIGAAQSAVAAPVAHGIAQRSSAKPLPNVAAKPLPMHCPMCAAMARAGGKYGLMPHMKCCCTPGKAAASCTCQCRPQPQTHTAAVLIWSPLALLPEPQVSAFPAPRPCAYSALSARLSAFRRSPPPPPPRLL